MIPFLLSWDTRERRISLKWSGFFSLVWEKGRILTRIFGVLIPLRPGQKKIPFRIRSAYLKEAFSFLAQWKVKKAEATLSLPDPMINGCLYGWISALEAVHPDRRIDVAINFLGENRFSGEATLSLRAFFHHLKGWAFLLLKEEKMRRARKRGELQWKRQI
ncbi:MAG: hypothetical protein ACE144_18780 [Thermodesulfobacteriota bacterium]